MGPEELARYRLKRVLGRGGKPGLIGGEVWEAEDTEHPRRVALKILRVDDEDMLTTQARFVRDAQAASRVHHPNLVGVRDAGEAGGTCFVVMELVEGKTLATMKEGASLDERMQWLREIAWALGALHDAGISHRDVKPENVVIRADGTACLVDLGVPFDDGKGAADAADDQAAWADLATSVLGDDVTADVRTILDRAGAADRDSRYGSMRDVVVALAGDAPAVDAAAVDAPIADDPAPASAKPGKPRVRRTLSPWVAVVALAVLIALAVLVQRALLE